MSQTYQDTLKQSTEYFGNELSAKVFSDKYALRDNNDDLIEQTPQQMHERIAGEIYRIEKDKFKNPLSYEEILGYLERFNCIIPQGSPMYGIGNIYKYVSLSNCFVLDMPVDSYAGIMHTDQQLVQISKRRGGCGISLDNLRPVGSPTKNSSRTSTGVISFADRYSHSTREVGQSGRRGALMLTLNVHHPQILDFAHCKDEEGDISGANISIPLTDEFLTAAMIDGSEYEQRWPLTGKPQITRKVDAKKVWDEIIWCAHNRAEPGLLFWDRIIEESPADCYENFKTVCTNPCSEIPLSVLDSCRLLVINLWSCVVNPFNKSAKFDFDKFIKVAKIAQRLMDDIIDLELEAIMRIIQKIDSDPESESIKQTELETWRKVYSACANGRRTGTGITALADVMAAIGIEYGSQKSINFVNKVYKALKLGCYRSSVDMAKELGPFTDWDHNKEKNCPFLLRIKDEDLELWKDMKKYGRRNIALLTTAPTGSTSTQAGFAIGEYDVSGQIAIIPDDAIKNGDLTIWAHGTTAGIEPLYAQSFTRRKKGNPGDNHFRTDFIDQSGDHWMEFEVYHPGVKMWMDITGETDPKKSPYVCAEDINWTNRVKLQAVAQQHVDHAISSTINLPNDVSIDEVAKIYETAWKAGCKGITVYRDGCRTGVLVDKSKNTVSRANAPKRPKVLPCDIHHHSVQNTPYFILVGMLDDQPYEVFAGRNGFLDNKVKNGEIVKLLRPKCYRLEHDGDVLLQPMSAACDTQEEALTRMISVGLRHGTPINFMVDQLEKVQGDMTSFARSIARALKKYIPDGTKSSRKCPECHMGALVREEGCVKCGNCGWAGCS